MSAITLRHLLREGRALREQKQEGFVPPASVAKAAERGLEARKSAPKSQKGGLDVRQAASEGIGSGVQRAVNLKNRDPISYKVIKQMKAFFARHEGYYRKARARGLSAEDSPAIQAWLLWGGDPGRAWANAIVQREESKGKSALKEHVFSIPGFQAQRMGQYSVNRPSIARSSRIGVIPDADPLPFRYQSAKDIYALIKDLTLELPTASPEEIVKRAVEASPYERFEISAEDLKLLLMSVEFLQNGYPQGVDIQSPMSTRSGRGIADWHGV